MNQVFMGFSADLPGYLAALSAHNNREWFKANQARYEETVREPARALVRALSGPLAELSVHLIADDRKVGGSLMRVQRDTRFSKDKTPYKTNVGIQLRHGAGKDAHAPAVYVHLELGDGFVGFGLWQPPPDELARIRRFIVENWDRYSAIVEAPAMKQHFTQHGDSLKRVPAGFDASHASAEAVKRRSFIALRKLDFEVFQRADAPEVITALLADGREYLAFLCAAVGQPF